MAVIYPDLETIINLKQKPEKGEIHLLEFLINNLNDDYEIYFQPYLNGDRPDIVVLRKDSGLLIIEVKDWDLVNYTVDRKGRWSLLDGTMIKSPFSQVQSYKENIFELHIDDLLSKQIKNSQMFTTVSCAVYFHNYSLNEINKLIFPEGSEEKYKKWLNYITIWGNNSLRNNILQDFLHKKYLDRKSKLFDFDLYLKIKRYLQPPRHLIEQGKEIRYSDEQRQLIVSKPGDQKIKGVAGCGKTLVLAKRAVNAYLRTKGKVLILTYNITLRNYIHDKINEVREDFGWDNFLILHYHEFFTSQANNFNLTLDTKTSYEENDFFERVKVKLPKYEAIFIDEAQDYKYEWFFIIKKYFLTQGGEFVIFADEKQNIYERNLDTDKKTKTNIPGRWNEQLKTTKRLSNSIIQLTNNFQNTFWKNKYVLDNIKLNPSQQELFSDEKIVYKFIEGNINSTNIVNYIFETIYNNNIHSNDIGILGPEIDYLREVDLNIRKLKKEKTRTMFETHEIYEYLKNKYIEKGMKGDNLNKSLKEEVERVRRSKKFNFWMNPGTIKISTIHSFKGWEIDTLFLIITEKIEEKYIFLEELIYTALTRAKRNLCIINFNNTNIHVFFKNNINNESTII